MTSKYFSVLKMMDNSEATRFSLKMRDGPKVIPILLCWPTTSEADDNSMVELSHQYSVFSKVFFIFLLLKYHFL